MIVSRWRRRSWTSTSSGKLKKQSGTPSTSGFVLGQPLDVAHPVVAQEPHGPTREARQARQLGGSQAVDQGAQLAERVDRVISRQIHAARAAAARDLDAASARDEAATAPHPDDAVAAPLLAAVDGLEQEAGLAVVELEEDPERGVEVG